MIPIIVGALFGFLFGSAMSGPVEKALLASFLVGAFFGVVVLVAGVPGWVGLCFGAAVFVSSVVAVLLPDTNFLKAFMKKALR